MVLEDRSFADSYSDAELASVADKVIGHFGGKPVQLTATIIRERRKIRGGIRAAAVVSQVLNELVLTRPPARDWARSALQRLHGA
ncbi:hypothetical protein MGN01_42560 [Methylobacterium gnaphalii]|uniref:Uncharacterized protein n=1 Tax=Methylobacterium gnaphalii TaxID=1010610 RepID=A0A512JR41_9HYPH|nr:hypothetical protein MGN01_42560 [Methylobacterium gnaphalii]GLS51575.1 hypothetical protein GCM10007885_44330 [Methylobacterium gnaphalii]